MAEFYCIAKPKIIMPKPPGGPDVKVAVPQPDKSFSTDDAAMIASFGDTALFHCRASSVPSDVDVWEKGKAWPAAVQQKLKQALEQGHTFS
jgi:tRNA A37 threonylcarbamoyltransferase TsaD